jgi:hypothetical protein
MLISEGYLNITQSSKIVNNGVFAVAKNLLNLMEGATFENNGQLSNMGMARIRTGSKLINNGRDPVQLEVQYCRPILPTKF